MEGANLAAQRAHDSSIGLAWHTAAFGGAAQAGKLKKLATYLDKQKPVQSPDEMLSVLEQLRDMGAPMTISQIN